MRKGIRPARPIAAVLLVLLPALSCTAYAQEPAALVPLKFLVGAWKAKGGGAPGAGAGAYSFEPSLQGRIIIRNSFAEYPASAGMPAYRHDDLMVIYADTGSTAGADYYDSEGHLIRYDVQVVHPGEAVFTSRRAAGEMRYRLTYRMSGEGTLAGTFEVAPPGKDFATYLSWTSEKAKTDR
ncbi:MAG TPA: hypothetical protein VMM80_03370 [Bacteroidota bacterium]|nr:hypothetical protein [Bacteroidota bacterium]